MKITAMAPITADADNGVFHHVNNQWLRPLLLLPVPSEPEVEEVLGLEAEGTMRGVLSVVMMTVTMIMCV